MRDGHFRPSSSGEVEATALATKQQHSEDKPHLIIRFNRECVVEYSTAIQRGRDMFYVRHRNTYQTGIFGVHLAGHVEI